MIDPLHKWLGIPPSEQPPNDYRLLGIALFEEDSDVIDSSADRQLAFLHGLANGEHSALAEELSNKVSAARLRLLNKQSKAQYDQELRNQQGGATPIAAAQVSGAPNIPTVKNWGDTQGESPNAPATAIPLAGQKAVPTETPQAAVPQAATPQAAVPQITAASSHVRVEGGSAKRKGFSRAWIYSLIPAGITFLVIIGLLIAGKVRLDPDKMQTLGIPKDIAEEVAETVSGMTDSPVVQTAPDSSTTSDSFPTPVDVVQPDPLASTENQTNGITQQPIPPLQDGSTFKSDPTTPGAISQPGLNRQDESATVTTAVDTTMGDAGTKAENPFVEVQPGDVPATSLPPGVNVGSLQGDSGFSAPPKKPMPTKGEIAEKMKLVSGLYKEEYTRAKTSGDKISLAQQIMTAANETNDDPAGRLALMRVARGIFIGESDYALTLDSIDQMAEYFQGIDSMTDKAIAIGSVKKIPVGKKTQYVNAVVAIANDSLRKGNFKACDLLLRGSVKHLSSGVPSSKAKAMQEVRLDYENARTLFVAYQSGAATLKTDPSNQIANNAVGKYLCLVELKWEEGFGHLVAGSDGSFKKAADAELALLKNTASDLQVGEAWYAVGNEEVGPLEKRRIFDRATQHYLSAKVTSKGLDALTINKRLKEIEPFKSVASKGGGTDSSSKSLKVVRLLDKRTWDSPIYSTDFAFIKETKAGIGMSLGMGTSTYGECSSGIELDGAAQVGVVGGLVSRSSSTSYSSRAKIGFMIDYHTPAGYTERVFLRIVGSEIYGPPTKPDWGQPKVSRTIAIGSQGPYRISLKEWAPDDWDGKIWFSIYLKDSGRDRALNSEVTWSAH